MNIKVKYVGSQPVAIMGVGYSGIVDTGDVISINEQFFLEIKNSKKWEKVEDDNKKKIKEQ